MLLRRNLLVIIYGVIIASGAVSGTEVVKVAGALGDKVSFGPDNLPASVSSITWKHIKDGETVKAIEFEDGETLTPNPRFNGITELDKKTGKITIKTLKFEHSGVYTIDISGKEQAQRYTLTVIEPVPQPKIKVEMITDNPGAVYLSCKYNETVIWKNSAGKILKGSEFENTITVEKNGNPEEFYTCTLENKASSKTSEPVYEKDLFKDQSGGGPWWIIAIVFILILLIICGICAFLYKNDPNLIGSVVARCPCSKGGKPAEDTIYSAVNAPKNPEEGNMPKNPEEGNMPKNPEEGNMPKNPEEGNMHQNPEEGNMLLKTKVGAQEADTAK